jgi:hypothetical protein
MPARVEVLSDGTIGREELLGRSRRRKPLHAALPLAGRPMGVVSPVVQVAMRTMFHTGEAPAPCRPVAFQLTSDQDPVDILIPFEELAKGSLRSLFVAPVLHGYLEDIPSPIYRPPRLVALPIDRQ